jgi:cellulose synthase/poly-beta-1,6-N-acetylglucosamine synthase-like glycosyltransferase
MEFEKYVYSMIVLKIIYFLVTGYFIFCTLYVLLYSVAGLFYKSPVFKKATTYRKIAILVPAYKTDEVVEELVDNVLLQDYPNFDLIIIADSLTDDVLTRLKQKPVHVIPFHDENRTKALALNTIMAQLPDDYDIALILDADNLIPERDYLSRLNDIFESGVQAVQTHRTAKNTNTFLALLDAASEEINNQLFRRGHVALGLSSALIGSAMAFDYRLYREQMRTITASGEDKELEMKLLRLKNPVVYIEDMIVLDEKVQKSDSFVDQRARWIANQLMQAKNNAGEGFRQLFRGNIDFFDKALQHFLMPRLFLIVSVTVFSVIAMIFLHSAYLYVWLAIAVIVYLSILISIPGRMYTVRLLKAVSYLPKAVILMFLSLFKLKGATKKFVATEHASITCNSQTQIIQ